MRITLFILLLSFAFMSVAQVSDSLEHRTVVFADTLGMDIYTAPIGEERRPVIIYVHGGGFSGGKRDQEEHLEFCRRYAERGWTSATISYHLTMKGRSFSCDQDVNNKLNTLLESGRNVNQAVAYLIEHRERFSIDPDRIVIVGSSAGAEAVLHAAYWDKARQDILPDSFQYAGIVSLSGALLDKRWITKETAIPTAFYHGTCDNLVPYGNAPHHYCDPTDEGYMMLYGAHPLAMRLEELSTSYWLITDCGGGHEWSSKPIREGYIDLMDAFLSDVILKQHHIQMHRILSEGTYECQSEWEFCD